MHRILWSLETNGLVARATLTWLEIDPLGRGAALLWELLESPRSAAFAQRPPAGHLIGIERSETEKGTKQRSSP